MYFCMKDCFQNNKQCYEQKVAKYLYLKILLTRLGGEEICQSTGALDSISAGGYKIFYKTIRVHR